MTKNYTKYTEKEWEDIKKDYIDNDITQDYIREKYNISQDAVKRLIGLKPKNREKSIIRIGEKYNRLTIIEELPNKITSSGKKVRIVTCQCDCGNIKNYQLSRVIYNNHTKSCGCIRETVNRDRIDKNRTYTSYHSMRTRCTNVNSDNYQYYGAKGVTICERWMDEENGYNNFKEDMKERPEGTTIDRINVEGNYEPNNCRWATPKEQIHNRRPR